MTNSETVNHWTHHAACKGKTKLFFVNRGDTASMRLAKAICETCPVINECREFIIYNPERFGIWAGMTEKDRRAYRLEQGIKLPNAHHGSRRRYEAGCRCVNCRLSQASASLKPLPTIPAVNELPHSEHK